LMLERGVAVVTVGFPATPVSCLRVYTPNYLLF
jgi:hypothetical protein